MAGHDDMNTEGREANAAQPLGKAPETSDGGKAGAERYPSVRQDDAVEGGGETRSFDPARNPDPPQGAGDTSPQAGHMGAGGDPAEGKR